MNILEQLKTKIETITGESVCVGRLRDGYNLAIRQESTGDTNSYLTGRERNITFIVFARSNNEQIARNVMNDIYSGLYLLTSDSFEQDTFCVNLITCSEPFFVDYTPENRIIYGLNINARIDE